MAEHRYEVAETARSRGDNGKLLRLLFVALGPVSLAGYLLAHMWLNLTGACYNLVIESSLSPLLGRPIVLKDWMVYALSPLIILVAPLAGAVHAALGLVRALGRWAVSIGRWQTGLKAPRLAGTLGVIWVLLGIWIVTACIDPRAGWDLLGQNLPGEKAYRYAANVDLTLGELQGPLQDRRQRLMAETPAAAAMRETMVGEPGAPYLQLDLQQEYMLLSHFPSSVRRYIAGLPWYYRFADESLDRQERVGMLPGCLLLAVLLMIRWPGTGLLARGGVVGVASYLLRVGVATGVVVAAFAAGVPAAEDFALTASWVLIAIMAAALVWWLTWKASQYWRLPRQYSPFLAMRLLQRKRIAFFSLGAVTLCVAMVLIVVSVMGGFLDMVRDRSHGLLGDLVVENDSLQGFPYYQQFIDKIEQWPQIDAAAPVIYSYGLLRFPDSRTSTVRIVGMRLNEADEVTGFKNSLFYEEWYPGTTRLDEQPQYVYGISADGRPVLPLPLEQAFDSSEAWKDLQTRPEEAARWNRDLKRTVPVFPGPGVYQLNPAEPTGEQIAAYALPPDAVEPLLPGIIIGRDIIAQRMPTGEYRRYHDYPRGMKIALTMLPISRSKGAIAGQTGGVTKAFRYADDSRTGVWEIDSQHVYVDFDRLQDWLMMGPGKKVDGSLVQPRASQIQIRVKPGSNLREMKVALMSAWDEIMRQADDPVDLQLMSWVGVQTWEEKQWAFISAVEKEKVLMLILFGVISVVAIFLILCIFYMIVAEKTRDIGIIKSVGGSAGGVAAIFLSYGAAIGMVGAVLGLLLGTVFVRYINDIQDWLASLHPELRVWKADVYSFDQIPNVVKLDDALVIGVVAVIAAIVGALVPALVAARKHPVESLRYE